MLVAYGRYAATQLGPVRHHLRRRRLERVGRRVGAMRTASATTTTPARSRRRASRRTCGCSGCSGHLTTLVPEGAEEGPRHRLRRGRDGRRRVDRSGGRAADHRRDRAARAARRVRPTSPSTTSTSSATRRCSVHIDDARHFLFTTDEKFDAITSDPLDPWVKGAAMLYTARVLRAGEAAPEPGRRRDALRPALREQHRGGEERDRHVLRGVPERDDLRQHLQRPGLRSRAARPGRSRRRSTSTRWRRG